VTGPQLADRIRERVDRTGARVSAEQAVALAEYMGLLEHWNRTINLTALPLDGYPESSLDVLVAEPLVAEPFLASCRTWVDLGSGGGSPAIPLKITSPEIGLTMVESRERKCAFLREAIRRLALPRATVQPGRAQGLRIDPVEVVTVRALRTDDSILETVRRILVPGGRLVAFSSEATPAFAGFKLESVLRSPVPGHSICRFVMLQG